MGKLQKDCEQLGVGVCYVTPLSRVARARGWWILHNYIFDEVKAYRARLARGARLVLKRNMLKGSLIDYWLNAAIYADVALPAKDSFNTTQRHLEVTTLALDAEGKAALGT